MSQHYWHALYIWLGLLNKWTWITFCFIPKISQQKLFTIQKLLRLILINWFIKKIAPYHYVPVFLYEPLVMIIFLITLFGFPTVSVNRQKQLIVTGNILFSRNYYTQFSHCVRLANFFQVLEHIGMNF